MNLSSAWCLAIGLGLAGLASGSPASAAGPSDPVPACRKGEVYSEKLKKCVKAKSSGLTEQDRTSYAYTLAKAGRYEEALELLDTLQHPDTAEALNYRGYATRKLGRTEEGIGYYLRSVALAPRYAKVREYLGEAYVQQGRPALAREQLTAIQAICGRDCEEYRDLAEALEPIAATGKP